MWEFGQNQCFILGGMFCVKESNSISKTKNKWNLVNIIKIALNIVNAL